MKVALVIGRYHSHGGGAERWTDLHARYLLARGIQVHLISSGFSGVPENAICHRIPRGLTTGSRLAFADRVERFCRMEGFDIVHDMGDGWHADFFMPHHGTRIASLEQNLAMLSPIARQLQSWSYRCMPRYREFAELERRQYSLSGATTFVAISRMVQADMQRFYGVPPERVRLVYNGVDTERFEPAPFGRVQNVFRWSDRVVFLLVAHNFQLKGLAPLIRAVGRLRRERAPVGLAVLGSGRQIPYRVLAQRLGCSDSVQFLGNRSDPVPYYQSADVYVQPTYYDPCSLVVLEALSCALPVITTRHNGASELLTPGLEGEILAEPQDVDALASSMRRYLIPTIRTSASHAARQLAQRHTLAQNSSAVLDLYRERLGLSVDGLRRSA